MFSLAYLALWLAVGAYIVHLIRRGRWTGRVATGTTVISWVLLMAGLVRRGLGAGHWPLTNRYEFALCFVWTIVAIYLLLEASWHERRAGAFALAMALLVATYAVTRPAAERAIAPLLPALRSVWLQVHVLAVMVGYAAFAVAAGLGVMRLMRRESLAGGKRVAPLLIGEVGEGEEIEHTMERVVALGFPWLTLGILTGAIWAQNAWGRYWGWDPKETWALITWLWYLLVLHVRTLRRWRGRRLAALVVAGFGLVLFTFIGVPWLVRVVRLESLHGF
ncbi:MAG: c-type cytochrome biogenesis protein CcsB [Anaerolineae bacterium]